VNKKGQFLSGAETTGYLEEIEKRRIHPIYRNCRAILMLSIWFAS